MELVHLNKQEVLNHYDYTVDWVENLNNLPEEIWRTQIAQGKWSIAEIVGHLIPWDEFLLTKRIPYFLTAALLPNSPESELVNQQSAQVTRNRSKKETIKLFMSNRTLLIQSLNDLPDELWKQDLFIGGNSISLTEYFTGLVEHDIHHIHQIQSVFK